MGIPVFFKTLITDYTHVIKPISSKSIHNLFFDLNCLIHPCCRGLTDELEMLDTIYNYILKINDLVKPKDFPISPKLYMNNPAATLAIAIKNNLDTIYFTFSILKSFHFLTLYLIVTQHIVSVNLICNILLYV